MKKILMLGDGGIGKTTLVTRVATGEVSDGKLTILLDNHCITQFGEGLSIFDFGGQKQFRLLLEDDPTILRGASCILLCFDLSRFTTFKNLFYWLEIIRNSPRVPIILVGTKWSEPEISEKENNSLEAISVQLDIYMSYLFFYGRSSFPQFAVFITGQGDGHGN